MTEPTIPELLAQANECIEKISAQANDAINMVNAATAAFAAIPDPPEVDPPVQEIPPVVTTPLSIISNANVGNVIEGGVGLFKIEIEGGEAPYDYLWQIVDGPTSFRNFQETINTEETSSTYSYGTGGDLGPFAGAIRVMRCVVTDSFGKTVASDPRTMTVVKSPAVEPPVVTPPPAPGTSLPPQGYFDYWKVQDLIYETIPTIDNKTVFEVRSKEELVAKLGDNRKIVVAPCNLQSDNIRLILHKYRNLEIISRERHGAIFSPPTKYRDNNLHISQCVDVTVRGFHYQHSRYYAVRMGCAGYPSQAGANQNIHILHSKVSKAGSGCFKMDNGWANGAGGNGLTDGIEIGYTEISDTAQQPEYRDFCEGFYCGSGDGDQYRNRVRNIHIHDVKADGKGMPQDTGGEFVEAKTYTANLTLERFTCVDWNVSESTSNAAVALSINSGQSGLPPDNGDKGYIIRQGRIERTDRIGRWQKGTGIIVGHGNTHIENVALVDNEDFGIAFMQHNIYYSGVFSNPNQLDVNIINVRSAGNRVPFNSDFNNAPHVAKVNLIGYKTTDPYVKTMFPQGGLSWNVIDAQYGMDRDELLEPVGGSRLP